MFNGSKVTEAALFHLWKGVYPQHLFSSLHCAPARAKHRVRLNYMVTHVTFVGTTAHFCMKHLSTYLMDHMLLWLTFLCGPSGDAMQRIPNQASEDWQRRKNEAFRAEKTKPWLDSFPWSLRRRDQTRKTLWHITSRAHEHQTSHSFWPISACTTSLEFLFFLTSQQTSVLHSKSSIVTF